MCGDVSMYIRCVGVGPDRDENLSIFVASEFWSNESVIILRCCGLGGDGMSLWKDEFLGMSVDSSIDGRGAKLKPPSGVSTTSSSKREPSFFCCDVCALPNRRLSDNLPRFCKISLWPMAADFLDGWLWFLLARSTALTDSGFKFPMILSNVVWSLNAKLFKNLLAACCTFACGLFRALSR